LNYYCLLFRILMEFIIKKKLKLYLAGFLITLMLALSIPLFSNSNHNIQLLEKRLKKNHGEKRLQILLELVRIYQEPEPQKALKYGKESLDLLKHSSNLQLRVDVLNHLSQACNSLGLYKASQEYSHRAEIIAVKTNYKKGHADSLFHIGRTDYYQGLYNKAASYLGDARIIYENIENKTGLAKTQNAIGLVYWKLGDYSKALELILDSCKIRENQKGKTIDADRDIAYSYNNIGLIYYELGNYEKSGSYLLQAWEIHKKIDNKSGIAIALNNLAGIYRDKGEYKEALKYYNHSLDIKKETGFKHGMAITLNNIGKVYERMEEYPKALNYLQKGLKISKEINQQSVIGNTLIYIGKIKRKMGLYREALGYIEQGLDIAEKLKIKAEIREAYKELADVYTALGDYSQTLRFLKKYKRINDLIFNETGSRKIAELQTRYEMEKNEKEIDLLKKDNAIHQFILKREKIFNYFIIAISLFILVIGFVLYNRYRVKSKMSRALSKEIEEHKRTTQKLLENEEKFKRLAESSIVGIYILQDDIIRYINPGFLSMFGYQKHEVLGKNLLDFIPEEDVPAVREKVNRRLEGTDDSIGYQFRIKNKKGGIVYLESYGDLIHYQGKPAILETVIDITGRKENAEKLLKSQKLEAMGILTGGIAHDFNNLLAVMVGYLEMIKDEIQIDSMADFVLRDIERFYNNAVELGKKLTYYARGGWINQQKVTLNSILYSAINECPHIASKIKTFSIPNDIWPVYGDERQLKQVIVYLLNNTHESTKENKKQNSQEKPLSLTAKNISLQEENEFLLAQGNYIRIVFTDINRQTPIENLEKIFEPIFSKSSSQDWKEMGLEMAMCHSIIKKHNGYIAVNAEPGKGTTFDFILPAYKD